MNGKAGTMSPEDFGLLSDLANSYSPLVLGLKVAKAASRISADYLHEHPTSAVGNAWAGVGNTIKNNLSGVRSSTIKNEHFDVLVGLVYTYGAELVIKKLGKIAKRSGVESGTLNTMFRTAA